MRGSVTAHGEIRAGSIEQLADAVREGVLSLDPVTPGEGVADEQQVDAIVRPRTRPGYAGAPLIGVEVVFELALPNEMGPLGLAAWRRDKSDFRIERDDRISFGA